MAKRKRKQSGFSARQAAEAAKRRKQEQNRALVRMAGISIVLVLIIVGVSVGISVLGLNEETTAEGSGAAGVTGTLMESDRPLADLPPAERAGYYATPPEMVIDTDNTYRAVITLEKGGEMVIDLFDDEAPITVNNFVYLANQGFYDGTVFHRVIEGFMAQGGDPTGTGTGGPGYSFQDEFDPSLRFDRRGLLAMANSGPATNGSQFFITFAPTEWLNDAHTIFGELVEGDDVLSSITIREPGSPTEADVIEKIEVFES